MLKSRLNISPQYFSAVVGNFYKGGEQPRLAIDAKSSTVLHNASEMQT